MIVRESLFEFQKTGNPKAGLNIGKYSIKDYYFENESDFLDYIIDMIPYILGTDGIPDDIINEYGAYIRNEYFFEINKFIWERNIGFLDSFKKRINSIHPKKLMKKLIELGFKKCEY